jgi:hypothetical protein
LVSSSTTAVAAKVSCVPSAPAQTQPTTAAAYADAADLLAGFYSWPSNAFAG